MSSFSSSRRAGREACFYGAQRDHPSPRRSSHTQSGCFKICVRPTAKASSLFLSPFARQFLVLSLEDARSILEDTPELFTSAIYGKARALAHFEPIVSFRFFIAIQSEYRKPSDSIPTSGLIATRTGIAIPTLQRWACRLPGASCRQPVRRILAACIAGAWHFEERRWHDARSSVARADGARSVQIEILPHART